MGGVTLADLQSLVPLDKLLLSVVVFKLVNLQKVYVKMSETLKVHIFLSLGMPIPFQEFEQFASRLKDKLSHFFSCHRFAQSRVRRVEKTDENN